MNRIILAVMGVALSSAAFAADSSGTVSVRRSSTPVGIESISSYTRWTAGSAAVSAGSGTFDVLAPRGTSSIIGCQTTAQDVSGTHKLLRTVRSGKQITVSNGPSATIAVSDSVIADCHLQP